MAIAVFDFSRNGAGGTDQGYPRFNPTTIENNRYYTAQRISINSVLFPVFDNQSASAECLITCSIAIPPDVIDATGNFWEVTDPAARTWTPRSTTPRTWTRKPGGSGSWS